MKIQVSDDTFRILEQISSNPLDNNATLLANGRWEAEIDDDNYDRLMRIQQPGETLDELLQRMAVDIMRHAKRLN